MKYQPGTVGSRPGSPSKRGANQPEEVSELDGIYDYFTSSRGKGGFSFQGGHRRNKNQDRDSDEESVDEEDDRPIHSSSKANDEIRRSIIDQYTTKDSLSSSLPYQDIFHLPEYLERIWNESLPFPSLKNSSSFSGLKYLKTIHQNYQKAILCWDPNLIREETENLIHEVYQQSSNELWNEMTKGQETGQQQEQDQHRRITIYQQLEFMRNTYLCGKGEFYQVKLSLTSLCPYSLTPPPTHP
jgi:hypothetical protein